LRGLSVDALALAEEHGHHALVATAHLAARMSVWRVDLLDERLRSDFAAQQAAVQSGRVQLQLNALLYLVSDLEEAGRIDEAEHWFGVVRELAARVRQPVYDSFVDFFDARRALLQGRYDEMTGLADRALSKGLQSHGINAEQAWAGLMFVHAWDRGQLPSLLDVVERSSATAPHLPIWRIAHAACALAAGDAELPRQVLDELIVDGRLEHRGDSLWYAAAGLLAEVARALDSEGHSAVLVEALRPYTGRWALTGLGRVNLGPVDRFLGIAAMTAGDLDVAAAALQRAEQLARARDAWPHVARALVDRASLVRRRTNGGDEAGAAALEAEAAALAEPLGLVPGPLASALKQH
jgi:hypothetical protein